MANKKRKCANCKDRKEVNRDSIINGIQFFCSNQCRVNYGISNANKLAGKAKKERETKQKVKDREKLESMKTVGEYIKEAQTAVNKYIRLRDRNKPCISCGSMPTNDGLISGQRVDAGHFRARGSAGHLRFNLLNIHKQCTKCNRFLSGNVTEYRKGLIERVGLERVEQLECDNSQRKFTIEYLKRVKKIFNKRARWYERRKC
jgi:hypothetical protein